MQKSQFSAPIYNKKVSSLLIQLLNSLQLAFCPQDTTFTVVEVITLVTVSKLSIFLIITHTFKTMLLYTFFILFNIKKVFFLV